MAEKQFVARQQQKHDIESNWTKAGENGFIPKIAEIIIYDKYNKNGEQIAEQVRFKIGDGIAKVHELPFIQNQSDEEAIISVNIIDGLLVIETSQSTNVSIIDGILNIQ